MDLRFGDPDRFAAAEPAAIDFRVFVATIAATQASSPAARAAAAARRCARLSDEAVAEDGTADASMHARSGAFHRPVAAALRLQSSATELKTGFTLAFQPSFKPPV